MTNLIASVRAVKEAIKNLIGEELYKDEGQIDICEIGPAIYSVYEKLFAARADLESLLKDEFRKSHGLVGDSEVAITDSGEEYVFEYNPADVDFGE